MHLLFEGYVSGREVSDPDDIADLEKEQERQARWEAKRQAKRQKDALRLERRKVKLRAKRMVQAYSHILRKPLPTEPKTDSLFNSLG